MPRTFTFSSFVHTQTLALSLSTFIRVNEVGTLVHFWFALHFITWRIWMCYWMWYYECLTPANSRICIYELKVFHKRKKKKTRFSELYKDGENKCKNMDKERMSKRQRVSERASDLDRLRCRIKICMIYVCNKLACVCVCVQWNMEAEADTVDCTRIIPKRVYCIYYADSQSDTHTQTHKHKSTNT